MTEEILPIRHKRCSTCKETKPLSEYNKHPKTKDKHSSVCRSCSKIYDKKRTNKKRIEQLSQNNFGLLDPIQFGYKLCNGCKKYISLNNFSIDNNRSDGLQSRCKTCNDKDYIYYREWDRIVRASQNNFGLLDPIYFGYKICNKCKSLKPISEFRNQKNKKYGLSSWCLDCCKEKEERYRLKNSDKLIEYNKDYYNKNTEIIKKRSNCWYYDNQEYAIERNKQWVKDNPEKFSIITKRWRDNHPEQTKEIRKKWESENKEKRQNITRNYRHRRRECIKNTNFIDMVTLEQWQKIIELQGNKCAICGLPFTEDDPSTQDHILPLSKGGLHVSWNIQAVHRRCNSRKNNKIDHNNIQSWLL